MDCNCNSTGSEGAECAPIGGQCECKPNVIGRQCTRCKPDFFGYPDCKQCTCPPTARCNEETGDCICAPHVTGTPGQECTVCEENTFGYDPITGCTECNCKTEGTVNASMSCNEETGKCFCKDRVAGRTCDRCTPGAYQYPDCMECPCDPRGTTEDICDQETAECDCKSEVDGDRCDTCKDGTFDLQADHPDGCTQCFCSARTSECDSHPSLIRSQIQSMADWEMRAFEINSRTITRSAHHLTSIQLTFLEKH